MAKIKSARDKKVRPARIRKTTSPNTESTAKTEKKIRSKPSAVNSENYNPGSLEFMENSLGRKATPQEAVELDQTWASYKIASKAPKESIPEIMSEGVKSGGKKRSLIGRQFTDIVDAGLADARVTESIDNRFKSA